MCVCSRACACIGVPYEYAISDLIARACAGVCIDFPYESVVIYLIGSGGGAGVAVQSTLWIVLQRIKIT